MAGFFDDLYNGFQSALPRGERLTLVYANILLGSFQSALPRGERLRGRA